MDISLFLAQVMGPLLLVIGLGVLMNKKHYQDVVREMVKDKDTNYFRGTIALVLGLLIVITHNVWVSDWPVVITLIGWLGIVKGAGLILFPKQIGELAKNKALIEGALSVGAVVVLLIGAYLGYIGFIV
jgi:hypothetical protein